jgi:outer membrane protein assembly factor BamA
MEMVQLCSAGNLSIDLVLNQLRTASATLLIVLFALLTTAGAQQRRLHLSKVDFIGLKRLTREQVMATSGLEIGQDVDPAILDAAAQKLMDSGLFKKLAYRVRGVGDQAIVTFTVEEAVRRLPVFFDNFAWFTDEEIYVAVRRDVTFFDGTVPEDGDTSEKIAAALRRLLNEKKVAGQVVFMPISDESGKQQLLFSVKGASLSVCSLHFPGAAAIPEDQLVKGAHDLLRTEYSRKDTGLFALHTLLPLYRHLGYWRAQFASAVPSVMTEATDGCKEGVSLTIPVDEGLQYSWDKAEWTGNQVLSADQLTASLGLKTGDVADDRNIDKALRVVHREYAKKGYMAVRLNESVTFDDTNQRVTYRFTVSEGAQYRMGDLAIAGLSDEDSRRVKELWRLAPGSVFDQSYVDEFVTRAARDFLDKHPVFSGVPLKIGVETKPDPGKQTVDVIITFK